MSAPMLTTGVCFVTPVSIQLPVLPSTCHTANLSGERRSPFVLSAMSPRMPSYASAAACISPISPLKSVALMPLVLPDSTTDAIALPKTNTPSYAE